MLCLNGRKNVQNLSYQRLHSKSNILRLNFKLPFLMSSQIEMDLLLYLITFKMWQAMKRKNVEKPEKSF